MVIIQEIETNDQIQTILKSKYDNPIILTPGPKDADSLRSINRGLFFEKNIDAITMANFTKMAIDHLCKRDKFPKKFQKNLFKKYQIYQNLIGVWEKVFPDDNGELFFQSYTILTDLRGSSLDLDLVKEALDLLNPDLKKAVSFIWSFIDEQGIVDEHRAYQIISELSSEFALKNDGIIVIGFTHLSAVQVDMINELGKCLDVMVVIPAGVMKNLSRFDWPVWLDAYQGDGYKEQKDNFDHRAIKFSQGRLSDSILANKKKDSKDAFVFLKDQLQESDIFEIPFSDFDYRVDHDLFTNTINSLCDEITHIGRKDLSFLKKYLKNIAIDCLKIQSKDPRVFIKLKTIHLIIRTVEQISEEYVGNEFKITPFNIKVIKAICVLNAPRSSTVHFTNVGKCNQVFCLSETKFQNLDNVSLVIKSENLPLKLKHFTGNREILSFLATIGPLKSESLKNKIDLSWFYLSIANARRISYLYEDGADEIDPELFKILKVRSPAKLMKNKKIVKNEKRQKVYQQVEPKYSATKLQTYVDCPKKFEEIYYLKNKNYPKLSGDILVNEMGILEHEAIQYLTERNKMFIDRVELESICKELLNRFIIKRELNISKIRHEICLNEITTNVGNGLVFLSDLKKRYNNAVFEFEVDISSENLVLGRIDLLVSLDNQLYIYDFKRSRGGIPSFAEITSNQAVQLPFYSHSIIKVEKYADKECFGMGYISLRDLEESIFINRENAAIDSVNYGKIKSLSEEDFIDNERQFNSKLTDIIFEINRSVESKYFSPRPRNNYSCLYCPANLFCDYEDES